MNGLKQRIHDEANGLDYIFAGDYCIPAIELPEDDRSIGKWSRMHQAYLEETNQILRNRLILTGRLHSYLADLNAVHGHGTVCEVRADGGENCVY